MFFGPQKVLAHDQCASREYSRKKVVLPAAVVTPRAQATVLKTCVLRATVELPGVLKVAPPSQATERICTDIAGSTRTHSLRPAKETGKITSSSTLDIHGTAMYVSEP